jgi:hypothetical protein
VNLSGKWGTDVRFGGKDMIVQASQWEKVVGRGGGQSISGKGGEKKCFVAVNN